MFSDEEKNYLFKKTIKVESQRDTCTPTCIAPLSTAAKRWKQPKCPSGDKWINKMWFIYMMEYFSALKRKAGFPCGSVVKNPPTNSGDSDLIPG